MIVPNLWTNNPNGPNHQHSVISTMNHHESSWHMNTSDLIAEHSRALSRVVLVRFWTKSGIVAGGDNQWGRMTVSPMECAHKDGIKMWYFLTNMIVWTCSKFFLVKHQHGHFTNSNVDPGRHRTSYPSVIGCDWGSWSWKWTTVGQQVHFHSFRSMQYLNRFGFSRTSLVSCMIVWLGSLHLDPSENGGGNFIWQLLIITPPATTTALRRQKSGSTNFIGENGN